MMWLWLLQEAGEPPHPTWTVAMRDIPLDTATLSHPQSQAAKPSRCVRALMSLNVSEEPQLGLPTASMGAELWGEDAGLEVSWVSWTGPLQASGCWSPVTSFSSLQGARTPFNVFWDCPCPHSLCNHITHGTTTLWQEPFPPPAQQKPCRVGRVAVPTRVQQELCHREVGVGHAVVESSVAIPVREVHHSLQELGLDVPQHLQVCCHHFWAGRLVAGHLEPLLGDGGEDVLLQTPKCHRDCPRAERWLPQLLAPHALAPPSQHLACGFVIAATT